MSACNLLEGLDKVFVRLLDNPYQFPKCRYYYAKQKEYRVAKVFGMNYMVIFKIINIVVCVMGVFHGTKNYDIKL